jgi:hypothetical protein
VTLAEWWRGRTDRRGAVLRGVLVEPVPNEVMQLAGLALGKVRAATAMDAIVAAFAVQRTGVIYTSDVADFESLQGFFPALRVSTRRATRMPPHSSPPAALLRSAIPPRGRRTFADCVL